MAMEQISEIKTVGDPGKPIEPFARGDIPRSEATLPVRGQSSGGQTLCDTSTVELIDLEQQSRSIKRLAELKSEECEIYKLLDRRLRSSLSQRGQPSGLRLGVSTVTAQIIAEPPPPRSKSPALSQPAPPASPPASSPASARPRSPRSRSPRSRSPRPRSPRPRSPRSRSPRARGKSPGQARRGRSRSPSTKRTTATKQRRAKTPTKRRPRSASSRLRSATRSPARSATRSPARSGTRSARRARAPHTARSPTPRATSRSPPPRKGFVRHIPVPMKPNGYPMRQLVPVLYASTFWALYCFNVVRSIVPPP